MSDDSSLYRLLAHLDDNGAGGRFRSDCVRLVGEGAVTLAEVHGHVQRLGADTVFLTDSGRTRLAAMEGRRHAA